MNIIELLKIVDKDVFLKLLQIAVDSKQGRELNLSLCLKEVFLVLTTEITK